MRIVSVYSSSLKLKQTVNRQLVARAKDPSNPVQSVGGAGGVPALTLNDYNFFHIQLNAAKLCDFTKTLSGNNLV